MEMSSASCMIKTSFLCDVTDVFLFYLGSFPPTDGNTLLVDQDEDVLIHIDDFVHIDDQSVIAFQKTRILQQQAGAVRIGILDGDCILSAVQGNPAAVVAVQV